MLKKKNSENFWNIFEGCAFYMQVDMQTYWSQGLGNGNDQRVSTGPQWE